MGALIHQIASKKMSKQSKIGRSIASPARKPMVWFRDDFWKILQVFALVTRHRYGRSLENCKLRQQC